MRLRGGLREFSQIYDGHRSGGHHRLIGTGFRRATNRSHHHEQVNLKTDSVTLQSLPAFDMPLCKLLPLNDNGYLPRKLPTTPSSSLQTPMSLFRDNIKLNVTDIATKYCELLNFYQLCNGSKPETRAIAAGTSVHLTLEKEAEKNLPSSIQIPDYLTLTESEKIAKKYLDMIIRLEALLAGYSVREFYVFGVIDDCLVTGYIDEISLDSNNHLLISDTKSRVKGNLPPVSQRLSAYHQLLVYHKLLSLMIESVDSLQSSFQNLYRALSICPDESFSTEFITLIEQHNYSPLINCSSLNQLEVKLRESLCKLAHHYTLSNEVQVWYYRSAGSQMGSLIDVCHYFYNEQAFQDLKEFSLSFWRGEREAIGVDPSENFKCRYCPMSSHCEWRATMEAAML